MSLEWLGHLRQKYNTQIKNGFQGHMSRFLAAGKVIYIGILAKLLVTFYRGEPTLQIIDDKTAIHSYLTQPHLKEFSSSFDINKIQLRSYVKGDSMILAGEPVQNIFFLVKGKVKIFTVTPEDKRLIIRFAKAPVR